MHFDIEKGKDIYHNESKLVKGVIDKQTMDAELLKATISLAKTAANTKEYAVPESSAIIGR